MALRFRKRLKIAKGLYINLGKRGASLSVGRPGATVNLGKKGVRTTVGLPGTGLSYTSKTHAWKARSEAGLNEACDSSYVNQAFTETSREVNWALALGILMMPYIFAWFTLRNGYSSKARMISFGWLIFLMFTALSKN